MANVTEVNITVDGPRNVIAEVNIELDTSDLSSTLVLDPAALSATNPPTNQLRIDELQWSVKDPGSVSLFWDASTQKRIVDMIGRTTFFIGSPFGGLQNDAGAGKTGKINMTTTGYAAGTTSASFVIHCTKQTV